jgi:hypothetical protein
MTRWQSFLTSLATPGGNILILCFFSLIMLAMVVGTGQKGNQQIITFMLATASTFLGALVGILRGRTSDPSGNSTSNTTTTATVVTPPPPTPAPGV